MEYGIRPQAPSSIRRRNGGARSLGPEDLARVHELADSADRADRILSNGILLTIGSPSDKTAAKKKIIEAARDPSLVCREKMDFLTTFLQLRSKLDLSGEIKDFVFSVSSAPEPELRCKATIILAEIARTDPGAVRILEALRNDPDESVRSNAKVFVNSLRKPPE